jgi:ribonuclease E
MVEKKKTEEKKTSRKIKASTGAWWKSTAVEDEQEKTETQNVAVEKKIEKASVVTEQTVTAEAATDIIPVETTAKAADVQPEPSDQKPPAKPKTPRKRAPRKKKDAVEAVAAQESVTVESDTVVMAAGSSLVADSTTVPAVTDSGSAQEENVPVEVVKPKRAPRKRPVKKTEPVQEVVTESSTDVDSATEKTEPDTVAEGEKAPAPKRAPRKRAPRKKKTDEAVVAATVEPEGSQTPAEPVSVTEPQGSAVEETVPAVVAEQEPQVKRTPRKRPPRRKKPVVKEEAEVETEVKAEVAATPESTPVAVDQVITPTEGELSVDVTSQEATATENAEEQAAPERKRRRPAHRKSRGRRRSAAKQGEAKDPEVQEGTASVEARVSVDDLDDDNDADWPEDSEGEFDDVDDRGADLPALPEGEGEEDREDIVLKLLINAEEPEECRLALLENGRLESIHVSTINRTQTKNNIYKGRIVAIEPNLQAAFVDYGTDKNGFLPFSEIHPEYYKQDLSADIQKLVDAHYWKKLSITDVLEKGQDVMVQVVKEEVGKKGANMTTYLSLPGRSVVLMPGSDSSGISRKISGEDRRAQLRTAMNSLEIPEGIGWIVRTASADITRSALSRDVGYLLRLWEEIKKKAQELPGVGQVYEDHQSVLRFLREHFDPSIEEILVDDVDAMEQVKEFISLLPSKQRDVKVRLHKGSRPIFNQFSVEDQIESIYQPRVNLPSGGSIVIEPTEALVSIDVNSGSTSKGKNFDQSIYQANMEAASEIGRQLRLRDLGGLIVVDFIDMRNKKHIRDVERMLKVSMKRDKAKVDFSRISKFGLMQISRQKLGSPIEAGNYRVCEHCKGRGTVRSVETLALFYLRRIQTAASRKHVSRVECNFPLDVAQYLQNKKRNEIHEHEIRYNTEIAIIANPGLSPVEHEITLHKAEKEPVDKKQG